MRSMGGNARSRISVALVCVCAAISSACGTQDLDPPGEGVVASRNPPPGTDCHEVGHFVGHEGGWTGDWISNDDLIKGAFNDLRNQAGEAGSNYVQHDPPTLGETDGTTTTATVSGTGFWCPKLVPPKD
jgi:hypothetical protein